MIDVSLHAARVETSNFQHVVNLVSELRSVMMRPLVVVDELKRAHRIEQEVSRQRRRGKRQWEGR